MVAVVVGLNVAGWGLLAAAVSGHYQAALASWHFAKIEQRSDVRQPVPEGSAD